MGQLLVVCGSAKTHKFGESVPFGVVPASTLTAGVYVLCSTSTIGNSINLLICRQGPSVTTVAAFSQLECCSKRWLQSIPFAGFLSTSSFWAGLYGASQWSGGRHGV